MTALPLEGFRVLDLTRLLPGNLCTWTLACLGAEVVKVEDTGAGDYQRSFGTILDGMSASHRLYNRGKRSICLDLKDPADRTVFERLLETSDALIESFRPGVMERLGYSPAEVHDQVPRLVYVRISGYGQDGPMAHEAGHDINYLALSGLLERLGTDSSVVVPPAPLADVIGGGLLPSLLTVAYLHQARASGRGVVVDAALVDAVALLPSMVLSDVLAGQPVPGRAQSEFSGGLACYSVYGTNDGFVAVGALEQRFWTALCEVVAMPEALRTLQHSPPAQDEIRRYLTDHFATRSRDEVAAAFAGSDACVTPVVSYEEMLSGPLAAARGYFEDDEPLPASRFPGVVDGIRLGPGTRAPEHGQHTDEILRELGTKSPRRA